jgi:hypothetical protein
MSARRFAWSLAAAVVAFAAGSSTLAADEPPAINPFGPATSQREDAVPGRIELSNGAVHSGLIYLTRDKRLQVYDEDLQRQREVPLQAIMQIDCSIKREWLEREWKSKETTSDEKMYTGRHYPAREYLHTITLKNGRTITGPLSAIVYLQPRQPGTGKSDDQQPEQEPERFLLNKRNKGEVGQDLKSLVYVKRIKLGKAAMEEENSKGGSGRRPGERKTKTAEE